MGNLNSREKIIVAAGSALALVFLVLQFIYLPALDRRTDLRASLAAERKALDRIRQLQREYLSLAPGNSQAMGRIGNRGKGFTLFSFLDRQAASAGVKGNIDYMKPHTRSLDNSPFTVSVVKLKLEKVVLRDFIRFIRSVEAPEIGIAIASLSVTKSGKDKKYLDITLEAETLMAEGGKL